MKSGLDGRVGLGWGGGVSTQENKRGQGMNVGIFAV